MCDFESMILARQEAEELFDDFSCPGCCKQCEFVNLCYEDDGEPFDYDLCFGCELMETCNKNAGVH